MAQGEREPESLERDPAVVGLAAAFAGFRRDSGGVVQEHNGRLHLVAVLAAGATTPGAGLVAIAQKRGVGESSGMHGEQGGPPGDEVL